MNNNCPLIDNTPVEKHGDIWVKREDLCTPPPAPPFSKVRGLYLHLQYLQSRHGITTVGYTETSISMAGWGVAWACADLGLRCIIFDPQYKNPPALLQFHRRQWKKFGAEIVRIKAGMARVNYNISKKWLVENYGDAALMLDLGLPLYESITATQMEAQKTLELMHNSMKSIVLNIGSGTIGAGIIRAVYFNSYTPDIIGIMGRSGNISKKKQLIAKKSQISLSALQGRGLKKLKFFLYDSGWNYTDKCTFPAPFPCHPYYDRKAWKWLQENKDQLKKPILFWNIGSIWRNPKEALYGRK